MQKKELFKTRVVLCCHVPGIDFYISQTEVIKLLNLNMYRDVILIEGAIPFDSIKYVTGSEFDNLRSSLIFLL